VSEPITREQALLRLHDHVGENIYAGLHVRRQHGLTEIFSLHGRLRHPLGEDPPKGLPHETRDTFGSLYVIGENALVLPELPGTITEADHGIEFELTDGLMLRMAWAADPEDARGYTHEDALADLERHIGQRVSVALTMTNREQDSWEVLPQLVGVLDAEPEGGYTVGEEALNLPLLPGTISRAEHGIRWLLANGLLLRIDWNTAE
jgi:hypothetical protein